jgi:hypothetical protein
VKSVLPAISSIVHKGSQCFHTRHALALVLILFGTNAYAAISWDGEGRSNWWFDPQNWSEDESNGGAGYLPPSDEGIFGELAQDAQINNGSGSWDVSGEGVVYDPDNDPFFANAASFPFPTGSPVAGDVGSDYGPEHIYRLYVSRNTTNSNLLTIKSGDLVIASTTIIGRSGSDAANQNLGMVVQTGGRLRLPRESLNIGRREESGWGNGTYEYRGGTLDVASGGGDGIRLSTGTVSAGGTGGHGRFRMGNPTDGGYVRTYDYETASGGENGDGILTGVGISEFIFENGATRPIQVTNNLVLSNGLDSDGTGIRSSRLELTLEEAPAVDALGVPDTLGLFQIDGMITGTGDLDNFFSNADATELYAEGAIVSAQFGSSVYNWNITYTGNITWTNADNSEINTITGPVTGNDIVLVGLSSDISESSADFDVDLDIDGSDFLIWQRGFGAAGGIGQGDADGNGFVDGADLTIWKSQYGSTLPAVSVNMSTVPEPCSLALLCAASLALFCCRKFDR